MSKKPEISIIMSVYNGESYLKEAVESVCNQTFKDWEFIIINDCSTDSTSEILDELAKNDSRIKVHPNEVNLKLPSSLNKALELSEGKYIARMDADDICLPERLEKQYNFMEANPDIDISSVKFMTLKNSVVASGGCGGKCDHESLKGLFLVTNPILHPGIFAKAEVMKALKYNPEYTCTEDMEIWSRAIRCKYKLGILPEYLMFYRLHDKQITSTTIDRQSIEIIKIQKKYYPELIEAMTEEQEAFYIKGIYFRRVMNVDKLKEFYLHFKKINNRRKLVSKDALDYAFVEILAEYKRCGIKKSAIIKMLLAFSPLFLLKEAKKRKQRALNDGKKCILSAEKAGYIHTSGTIKFPVFSKKINQESI